MNISNLCQERKLGEIEEGGHLGARGNLFEEYANI